MKIIYTLSLAILAATCLVTTALASPKTTDENSLKVYALDCGHILFKDFAIFSDAGEYDGKERELSDMCVLVRHPKGNLLWDTGLPKTDTDKKVKDGYAHYVTTTIEAQLAQIDLKPEDINYVSISHAHFDHTGNLNDFGQATWLLQDKELAYGLSTPTPFGVLPETFSKYKTAKTKMLNGDYDVFGDGVVRFFRAPGHTPGHQVMLVKLKSGNILFSGDLYHQEESFKRNIVPSFNNDRADTLASSDRIHKLLKHYDAKLVVQHDKKDFEALPKFPAYLQ